MVIDDIAVEVISQVDIHNLFEEYFQEGKTARYKKFQYIEARKGDEGEVVVTIIRGEIETTNKVQVPNAAVVMNMTTKSREQYILLPEQFQKRYLETDKLSDDWQRFYPKGEVDAVEWDGESIQFVAPWGEPMVLHKGDFFCRVPDTYEDVYRIARQEFFETYKK